LDLLAKKPEHIEEQKEKELANSMSSNQADKAKLNDDTVFIENIESDLIDPQFRKKILFFLNLNKKMMI